MTCITNNISFILFLLTVCDSFVLVKLVYGNNKNMMVKVFSFLSNIKLERPLSFEKMLFVQTGDIPIYTYILYINEHY